MIKLIFMLKRRSGMTTEQFVERYETGHVPLGERHVPNAIRYVRRYLTAIPGPFSDASSDFDVITELWFGNQEEFEKAMVKLAEPEIMEEIIRDEEQLFDRPATRVYLVEERDSICK